MKVKILYLCKLTSRSKSPLQLYGIDSLAIVVKNQIRFNIPLFFASH